jgi:hypothetical protein
LDMHAFAPSIITDCLGILDELERGSVHACSAARPLARLWVMVFGALDGSVGSRLRDGTFTWMPSHGNPGTIGISLRSDGQPITAIDWRANRLADALAKNAARGQRLARQARRFILDAAAAVEFAATRVGTTSYASNNCMRDVVLPDGTSTRVCCRDSTARRPNRPRQRARMPADSAAADVAAPQQHAPAGVELGSQIGSSRQKRSRGASSSAAPRSLRQRRAACRRAQEEAMNEQADARFRQLRHMRLQLVPGCEGDARERLDALRDRVLARSRL